MARRVPVAASGELEERNPIRGMVGRCCASPASGTTRDPPTRSKMTTGIDVMMRMDLARLQT